MSGQTGLPDFLLCAEPPDHWLTQAKLGLLSLLSTVTTDSMKTDCIARQNSLASVF